MRFIVASHNKGKVKEIQAILADEKIEVLSLSDVGFHKEIEETGSSFSENARIKARAVRRRFPDDTVIADDSGLCIAALDGAPGIYSARFGGEETAYPQKFSKIWQLMKESGNPDRSAAFQCSIAVYRPDGSSFVVEGIWEGEIILESRGEHGFGYDAIFYLPTYGQTAAELDPAVKNRISHRALALQNMRRTLRKEFS